MKIAQTVIKKIIAYAQKGAPIEMCGYLAGRQGVVVKHYELTNVDGREDHFSFDPKEQFATIKDARARGLEVCAIYHSHPASPARPSAEDIRLAYDPHISYVIVSLAGGDADVKSYKINNGKVVSEEIEVVEGDSSTL